VRLSNGANDCETKRNTAGCDGAEWLLNELEDARQALLLDPRAAIGHRHSHARFARAQMDSDERTLLGMPARVLNQIHKDLGESSGVRVDAVAATLSDCFESLLPLVNQRHDGWRDLLSNLEEVYRLRVNPKPITPNGSCTQEVLRPTLKQKSPLLHEVNGGSHFGGKRLDVFCEQRRESEEITERPA
jgi:hypothetical protein